MNNRELHQRESEWRLGEILNWCHLPALLMEVCVLLFPLYLAFTKHRRKNKYFLSIELTKWISQLCVRLPFPIFSFDFFS